MPVDIDRLIALDRRRTWYTIRALVLSLQHEHAAMRHARPDDDAARAERIDRLLLQLVAELDAVLRVPSSSDEA